VLNAAIQLLALKGCQALTMADVAEEAKLTQATIKRHFPAIPAIYAAIVERYATRYYESTVIRPVAGRNPEEHVRQVVRRMVDFFRTNIELAIAADVSSNQDIPEIHDQAIRTAAKHRGTLNDYFRYIGLDNTDPARKAVARGFFTNMLFTHFRSRYVWEHRLRASARKVEKVEKRLLHEPEVKYDDAFYASYAEMVAQMYLHGIDGLARAGKAPVDDELDGTFWLRGLV
jgi:AcrR family transcriptional regulator